MIECLILSIFIGNYEWSLVASELWCIYMLRVIYCEHVHERTLTRLNKQSTDPESTFSEVHANTVANSFSANKPPDRPKTF